MSGQYANATSVSVEKSRAEIEGILAKYGAERFAYATEPGRAAVMFQITDPSTKTTLAIRMVLPLPSREEERFTNRKRYNYATNGYTNSADVVGKLWEQACRSSWRALLLVIKAKLEACACGISTIEREFLADVITSSGETIGEQIRPQLKAMSDRKETPRLLMGAT